MERSRAPSVEVVRGHDERERDRHRERVRGAHGSDGLDVHEYSAAPRDVGGHRRDEVDQPDDRDRARDESRHVVEVPERPEPCGATVEAKSPSGRVAAAPDEIAPVLRDEPEADRPDQGRGHGADETRHAHGGGARKHDHAEVPLVEATTADVHPQTEPVAFDP